MEIGPLNGRHKHFSDMFRRQYTNQPFKMRKINTDLERTALQTHRRHYETRGRHYQTGRRHMETGGRHNKRPVAILDACTLSYTRRKLYYTQRALYQTLENVGKILFSTTIRVQITCKVRFSDLWWSHLPPHKISKFCTESL